MIVSKFGFYHRSAAVAAVGRRSTACRSIDSTDSNRDVDKLARCVICRNRSTAAAAVVAVAAVAAVG